MPVTPTYPGIYIEELPSSARTITAAPTSVTVFVGYTHPFKTRKPGQAIEIFNFTEYEREFGGFYTSSLVDCQVAHAVNQFFINGGSIAYVVGIQANYHNALGAPISSGPGEDSTVKRPEGTMGGIKFIGLEPTEPQTPMTVAISNLNSTSDAADIVITYGSRVEVYRGVSLRATLPSGQENKDFIENRLGTDAKPLSALVRVAPASTTYPATYPTTPSAQQVSLTRTLPSKFFTTFHQDDFTAIFQADSSLDKVSIFNLLLIPGVVGNGILSTALAFCERKQAFFIMDPPPEAAADSSGTLTPIANFVEAPAGSGIAELPKSQNGALYFPYLKSVNPITGDRLDLPPSGFVAGIYARTDLNRGVWKAPAGLETTILNTTGVVEQGRMTDQRQGTLNPIGVNCLRSFPGVGTVVYGARTLRTNNPAYQQWRYVPVRRMALFIEQTLYRNLGWVVFEPNDEPLWVAIRTSIENFMLSLFNQGAFQGSKPSQAFQVKCDASTTTQTDIDNGIVNIIVAFAPLKPAEFVIVKIAQLAGQVQS